MNIQQYKENQKTRLAQAPQFRKLCLACLQPDYSCYCKHIKKFNPGMKFVILIHPLEMRRRIATGRMSYLCLENSELIVGHNYTTNYKVNSILWNKDYHSVILYPGRQSTNVTTVEPANRAELFPRDKKLALFVVDGTWNTAKKMVRLSENLVYLPQICFTPPGVSNFRVRKQPKPQCYSTVEAIHHTIELLGPSQGFNLESKAHHNLIHVFDSMVEQQLAHVKTAHSRHKIKYPRKTQSLDQQVNV